ncbi:MAG: TonB-dependent receptor [Candidatus Dadabacteria bacterium]|nr:MAG: TonB-dependent receptor [Candidatus Dadabacteria bacterium]
MQRRNYMRALAAVVLAGTWVVASSGARAQDEQQEVAARSEQIEEITVTAQKREESLQAAPLSITALSSTMIEDEGIDSLDDISKFTPNLNIHPNTGGNTGVTINMRGAITSDPLVTLEPTVGVYVDGVYVAKSAGSLFDLVDLERIEVMRGPQGTLYGRNTVGGAINLITKKPTAETSATTSLTVGNFRTFIGRTTLNFPLLGEAGLAPVRGIGTVNARTTLRYHFREGFVDNTAPGSKDFDDMDRFATRTIVRWEPTDRLTVDYAFDYHRSREEPSAFQLTAVRPGSPTEFLAPYIRTRRADQIGNNRIKFAAFPPRSDERLLASNLDVRGHSLTVTADLGEVGPLGALTFKSISSYRSVDELSVQDLDGTPINVADFGLKVGFRTWSEELQLAGVTDDARINYVLGFYYYGEKGGENNPQVFFGGGSIFNSGNRFDNYALAPFGQASWVPPVFDDAVTLTAGLRYTYEKKKQTRNYDCVYIFDPDNPAGNKCDFVPDLVGLEADKSFDNLSPMGNIAVQLTEDLLAYGRISRGFKSGGFNGRATTKEAFLEPYSEETLTSYEIGMKSEWFDNRLRLNASGFFNDYDDLQVAVFEPTVGGGTVSKLQNAAKAEIWGAEVELLAIPLPGVDVRATYAFLDPDYKRFCNTRDPETGRCTQDISDTAKFVLTPDHTVSLGVGYTAPPTDRGTFSLRLDGYWQDAVYFLVKDNYKNNQGGYILLNGRAELTDMPTENGTIDIALWVRNILNTNYREFGIDFGEAFGYSGNIYGDPRTIGVELVWNWAQG